MIDNISLLPIIRSYMKANNINENEQKIAKLCERIAKIANSGPYSLEELQIACYCVNVSLKTHIEREKMELNERRYIKKNRW